MTEWSQEKEKKNIAEVPFYVNLSDITYIATMCCYLWFIYFKRINHF